jgi:DNA repair exonuclease SbcCD ATPase subunit
MKEKKKLDARLQDMEENLKSRKVDLAMLEKELTKINKNMKKVLEYSVYEQDPTTQAIEITMGDTEYKLRSYMDLAEIKARSQDLFEEIIQAEQEVARLQKKLASIHHVVSETEQISQKKIKRMEEDCTKLELKIAKEKNEVEELEKSLKDLKEHTSNYSDRIEILEDELKKFREKETENELLLRDMDRSLEQIQKKVQQIVVEESKVRENTIELDYMANLGLLMDTDSKLNLLPEAHKKDYRYFGINRILQNAVLVLVTVFTLAAYAQRSKIDPLEAGLPGKYAELSLLNVRQDVKQLLEKQAMVVDAFQVLIDEDKALSSNMVTALKYLSNAVPENFEVTNLILDKDVAGYAMDDSVRAKLNAQDNSMFIIALDGFYNQGVEKAIGSGKLFQSALVSNSNFKAVYFSPAQAVNKWKTSFSINLLL